MPRELWFCEPLRLLSYVLERKVVVGEGEVAGVCGGSVKQRNNLIFQPGVMGGPVGNGVSVMVMREIQPGDKLLRKRGRMTVGMRQAEKHRVYIGSLSTGVNKHVNNKGGDSPW